MSADARVKAARGYTVKRSGKTHYTKSQRRARIQKARDERLSLWVRLHRAGHTQLEYRHWCHPFMRKREEAVRG